MRDVERDFLLAIERGDMELVRDLLSRRDEIKLNVNCCDPLARGALIIAIENENLQMIKLLMEAKIDIGDSLLYAIEENFVEAVELLLDYQDSMPVPLRLPVHEDSIFGSDLTPLTLAAHKNNFEIVKLLLDRKTEAIVYPHDPRCDCSTCCRSRSDDCLKHSQSRINSYRALASPCMLAMANDDPLLAAFRMSEKLENLARMEPEYKEEYLRLRSQCQTFATRLMDHTRTSKELELLLNYNYHNDDQIMDKKECNRLKMAIQCKQKTFCAHPNIQELLATMWYENLPGFRQKSFLAQAVQVIFIGLMFPIYSAAYLIAPHSKFGSYIKKPFIKFICHSASYMTFLIVLILASQRVEAFYNWSGIMEIITRLTVSQQTHSSLEAGGVGHRDNLTLLLKQVHDEHSGGQHLGGDHSLSSSQMVQAPTSVDNLSVEQLTVLYKKMGESASVGARSFDSLSKIFSDLPHTAKKRGAPPSPIETIIVIWVVSLIWAEIKQIRALGMNYYKHDMWNILDSVASGFYIGAIILRLVSYCEANEKTMEVAREHWNAYDPTLLSEGLFATATIFSALKLVYIFSLNPYLGPLQISLGRMIMDIVRFSWIYLLVLFAFACGMNQLLWYYADLERHQCLNVTNYSLAQYYSGLKLQAVGVNDTLLTANITAPPAAAAIIASSSGKNATTILATNETLAATTTTMATTTVSDLLSLPEEIKSFSSSSSSSSLSFDDEDDSSKPPVTIDDSCKTWRHFSNVFESSQTLFWANFGLVDLENFDLTGIRQYTRFWALLMFGVYCFINVIVVLNMLIAMMNHSYVKISTRSDVEWKFARTRLWMSYFDDGSTVPAPFNIVPSLKSVRYCIVWLLRKLSWFDVSKLPVSKKESYYLAKINNKNNGYSEVIRLLIRRYLIHEARILEKKRELTEAKLNRWAKWQQQQNCKT